MMSNLDPISPALLDNLPLRITLPEAVEIAFYREIANDRHAENFAFRVKRYLDADPAGSYVHTIHLNGMDHESLIDYLTSSASMSEGLGFLDVASDVALTAMNGSPDMPGFVDMGTKADHKGKPLTELVDFPPEHALSSIVLARRDMAEDVCDVNDRLEYEPSVPDHMALQSIPGNLEIILHRGATFSAEETTPDDDGTKRYNVCVAFGVSLRVRVPECLIVHVEIGSDG